MVAFDNTLFCIAILPMAVLLVLYIQRRRPPTNRRHPPTPLRLPIVRNIPQFLLFRTQPLYKTILRWRKIYGDVFMTELGAVRIVWVSGLELTREVLQQRGSKFDCRPNWMSIVKETRQNEGILHNSGTTYKQLKLLLDNATKHCYPGIREKSLDNHIYTEIEAISNSLHEIASEGKSVQMDRLVHESFTNLLYAMIFGTSLRLNSEKLTQWLDLIENIKILNKTYTATDFFPWLPTLLSKRRNKLLKSKLTELHKVIHEEIRRHRKTFNLHKPVDVIDFYIEAKKNGIDISENNLQCLILDCFMADVTTNIFLWILAYLTNHQDVQQQCRKEIIKILGTRLTATAKDTERLSYTRAMILEVLRLRGQHLTYPHATFKDVKLANYYIPKHSIVVVNLASVHQDPKLWDHPLVFRPERFLDEYGLLRQLDRFFPYGLGSRKCTLHHTSETVLCLFMVNIIRRFKLEAATENKTVDLTEVQESFHSPVRPKRFSVKITELL